MIRSLLFSLFLSMTLSQTTGKISGIVIDGAESEPLPGANIYLEQTSFGTASDGSGRFTLINIPPGKYVLKVDMIGYKSIRMEDVNVSVNRTLSLKRCPRAATFSESAVAAIAESRAVLASFVLSFWLQSFWTMGPCARLPPRV